MNVDSGQSEYRTERCQHCQSEFRLPQDVKESAKIQCPSCGTMFRLSDVVGPPVAIVVEDEPEPETIVQPDIPIVDRVVDQVDAGDANLDEAIRVPSYEKTTARGRARAQGIEVEEAVRKPTTKRRSRRSDRAFVKKRSKSGDFLRIVLGGLIAIPVAQLVLWWLFAKDPLSLGPVVGKYVPFVVPAKLLPEEERRVESQDDGDPDVPRSFKVVPDDELFK